MCIRDSPCTPCRYARHPNLIFQVLYISLCTSTTSDLPFSPGDKIIPHLFANFHTQSHPVSKRFPGTEKAQDTRICPAYHLLFECSICTSSCFRAKKQHLNRFWLRCCNCCPYSAPPPHSDLTNPK